MFGQLPFGGGYFAEGLETEEPRKVEQGGPDLAWWLEYEKRRKRKKSPVVPPPAPRAFDLDEDEEEVMAALDFLLDEEPDAITEETAKEIGRAIQKELWQERLRQLDAIIAALETPERPPDRARPKLHAMRAKLRADRWNLYVSRNNTITDAGLF